jgi:carbonic anhydrase/acetyltransferase-like protein (isoleucine patch superfamily)
LALVIAQRRVRGGYCDFGGVKIMKRCIIRARALATEGEPLEDKLLVLNGKRIESILPSSSVKNQGARHRSDE